jgi:hypothetical protein
MWPRPTAGSWTVPVNNSTSNSREEIHYGSTYQSVLSRAQIWEARNLTCLSIFTTHFPFVVS